MLRQCLIYLKKSGKPMDTPPYKYIYTPWDDAGPTPESIRRQHKKFSAMPHWRHGQTVDVTTMPDNMYTYGKEGMSLPIAIFKDQTDPVIGPEWTYPGIYEMKQLKPMSFEQLVRKEEKGELTNVWERRSLRNKTNKLIFKNKMRMGRIKAAMWLPMTRERGKKPKSRAETAAQKKAEAAAAKPASKK